VTALTVVKRRLAGISCRLLLVQDMLNSCSLYTVNLVLVKPVVHRACSTACNKMAARTYTLDMECPEGISRS